MSEEEIEPTVLLVSMLGNEHEAYWNRRYIKEIEMFNTSSGDESDPMEKLFVWFGRIHLILTAQTIKLELCVSSEASILDVGCGNGFMCEILFALGFLNVTGTDYCSKAINLCQKVRKHYRRQQPEKTSWGTRYFTDDILQTRLARGAWDFIHDCGTLDSISMTLATPPNLPTADLNPAGPPDTARSSEATGSRDDSDDSRFDQAIEIKADAATQEPTLAGRAEAEAAEAEAKEDERQDRAGCGDEEPLWQGPGAGGYLRNIAALLRPADGRAEAGRLLLRSCSHSVVELEQAVAACGAPLRLLRDLSLTGTDVVTTLWARC